MLKTIYVCDKCKKETTYEGPQFVAKPLAQVDGWKTRKEGAMWKQYCAECLEGEKSE